MAEKAETIESVRGYEGIASVLYFDGMQKVIRSDEFIFIKRNKRPPKDPVNAMLSLGYTLLLNAVNTAVYTAGLDPYAGCLHELSYGRSSLSLDLMEEFRPVLVDQLILFLINKRVMRLTDFYFNQEADKNISYDKDENIMQNEYPVLLNHEGMKKFIMYYERNISKSNFYPLDGINYVFKDIILNQVRLFVRWMKGDGDYQPFTIR